MERGYNRWYIQSLNKRRSNGKYIIEASPRVLRWRNLTAFDDMVRFVSFVLHRLSVCSCVNVFCVFIIYVILVLSLDNIVQEAAFGVRAQLNCLRV